MSVTLVKSYTQGRGTGVARGRGPGRDLGDGLGLGVPVAVGVAVGVALGVAVGVAVGLAVGVGVGVGVLPIIIWTTPVLKGLAQRLPFASNSTATTCQCASGELLGV